MHENINNIKALINLEKIDIKKELQVTQELEDDYLERFLEARNYDLYEGLQMIREHVNWYNNEVLPIVNTDASTVLGRDISVLNDHLPCWLQGFDKNHSPILYSHWGNVKFHEIIQKQTISSIDRILMYLVWINEQMIKLLNNQTIKLKKKVHQWTFVINAEGWNISSMSKLSMEFIAKLVNISQNNYPGRLNRIFIINAPRAFSFFWTIFKNWLDDKTKERMFIYNRKEIWIPALKEYIHEKELPDTFGGSTPLIPLSNIPIKILKS